MTRECPLPEAEEEALSQSLRKSRAGASIALDAAESEALAQSTPARSNLRDGPSIREPSSADADTIALEQSFGIRGKVHVATSNVGGASGDRPVSQASDAAASTRSAEARATVNAAVMKAAEISNGHKATAAFILTIRASADPELRDALLAGNGEPGRQTVSQIADAEVANFLGTTEGPGR